MPARSSVERFQPTVLRVRATSGRGRRAAKQPAPDGFAADMQQLLQLGSEDYAVFSVRYSWQFEFI